MYKYKYQVQVRVPSTKSTKEYQVPRKGESTRQCIENTFYPQSLCHTATLIQLYIFWAHHHCFIGDLFLSKSLKSSSHLGGEYSPGLCLGSPGISSGKSSLRTSPDHHYHYHHFLSQQWNLTKLRRGNSLPHRPARVVVNVSYMPAEVAVVTVVSHPHLVLGKVGVFCARTSAVRTNTRSQHHFSQGPETHQTDFPSKCKI